MKQLRDLFRMLCTEYGITIMLSSHMLSEVETIADTIGVIHRGTMMQEISMREITEKHTTYMEAVVEDTRRAAYVLADQLKMENFKVVDGKKIRIYDVGMDIQEITKALAVNKVGIISIGKRAESLEEYFLKLTEGGIAQ